MLHKLLFITKIYSYTHLADARPLSDHPLSQWSISVAVCTSPDTHSRKLTIFTQSHNQLARFILLTTIFFIRKEKRATFCTALPSVRSTNLKRNFRFATLRVYHARADRFEYYIALLTLISRMTR